MLPLQELPPRVYLLDKPSGISSRQAALALAHHLGAQKAGHAGTLDRAAEGLLIVGIGKGTRNLSAFVGLPKTYDAVVCLGRSTTTDDQEGEVEESKDACHLSEEQVRHALQAMQQEHTLVLPVPRWSAVRVGGKRLYHLARKGKLPSELPRRPMEVQEATLLSLTRAPHEAPPCALHAWVRWRVSSGTYIRSLARELGRRLGIPASLCGLRRVAVGPYTIDDPRVWRLTLTDSDQNIYPPLKTS